MVNTYTVDYSDDYLYLDGIETMTFTAKNPSGTPLAGVKALRSHPSRRQTTGGVLGVEPTDVMFVLWIDTLDSNTPKNGDNLTDSDGVVYIISSVVQVPDLSQYKCFCVRGV